MHGVTRAEILHAAIPSFCIHHHNVAIAADKPGYIIDVWPYRVYCYHYLNPKVDIPLSATNVNILQLCHYLRAKILAFNDMLLAIEHLNPSDQCIVQITKPYDRPQPNTITEYDIDTHNAMVHNICSYYILYLI